MSRLAEGGFARAALQSGCRFSAGLAEARALMAAGRPEEAESVLCGLTAPDERDETTLALVRAWNLFWTLDRPDDAGAVLTAGERALEARAAGEADGPGCSAQPAAAPPTTGGADTTVAPAIAAPPTTRGAANAVAPATAVAFPTSGGGDTTVAPAIAAPPTTSGAATAVAPATERPSHTCCASPVHAPGVAELYALRARFAFAQGDPRAALAIAAPIEADECAPEAARVRAAVAMAEALAVCGRRDEAVAVARRWEPASQRQLAGAQALAHWLAGSLYEATFEAERAYAAATDAQGWAVAALLLGHVWLSRGDTDAALRWFRESSVLLRGSDPVAMRPAALAGVAQAAAQAGDAAHAQAALAELDRIPQPAGRGVGEELGLARAWTAHVCGDRPRAVAIATAVLAAAEARGADGFAARARAELTRLS